jgi:hypothetical protein
VKVNFNNLRKNAGRAYAALAKKLNEATYGEAINLPADEIQEDMDDLRTAIAMILCVYEEDNADFIDLSDETYKLPFYGRDADEATEQLLAGRKEG